MACTDEKGAMVVASRIDAQLADLKAMKGTHLKQTVSITMIEVPKMNNALPTDQQIKETANRIQKIIYSILSDRRKSYGRKDFSG